MDCVVRTHFVGLFYHRLAAPYPFLNPRRGIRSTEMRSYHNMLSHDYRSCILPDQSTHVMHHVCHDVWMLPLWAPATQVGRLCIMQILVDLSRTEQPASWW